VSALKEKPLNRYVLTDELYTLLKKQILAHTMQAGDKINIDRLARDLGVSNIPIRESLSRLASEGFVTIVPYKGMFVAGMSLADVDDLFEIRLELEDLAIRKAAPHIPEVKLTAMLEEQSRREESAEHSEEEARISRMNHDLHGTILLYAGNENLRQMVTSIIERIHRYLNYVHYKIEMGAEQAEHESIIRALLERDANKAAEAMQLHIQKAHQRLRANFDK
jgi:DNA-binding GntR family transcriptional regulator